MTTGARFERTQILVAVVLLAFAFGILLGAETTRRSGACRGLYAVGVGEAGHELVALVFADSPGDARRNATERDLAFEFIDAEVWQESAGGAIDSGEARSLCGAPRK